MSKNYTDLFRSVALHRQRPDGHLHACGIGMHQQKTSVVGIYQTRDLAEGGIADLLTAGFSNEDISVLLLKDNRRKTQADFKSANTTEGALPEAASGVVIGGMLGFLRGFGVLRIRGLGSLFVAGPIVADLSGVGADGAVRGRVGGLIRIGIPEFLAERYRRRIKEGGILLSAHCRSAEGVSRATDLLRQTGAEDISLTDLDSTDYQASSWDEGQH